eukprot:COSAG01_NODE_24573_length_774_cov_1.097778_2_plen_65_part_01
MVNAKTFLEKRYNEDIELEDAIHTAILTLKVRSDWCRVCLAVSVKCCADEAAFVVTMCCYAGGV